MRTSSRKVQLSAFITTPHKGAGNPSGDMAVHVTEIKAIFILQKAVIFRAL